STYRDRQGRVWKVRVHREQNRTPVDLVGPMGHDGPVTVRLPSVLGILHLFESAGTPNVLWARDGTSVYRFDTTASTDPKFKTIAQDGDLRQALVDPAGVLWYVSSRGIFRIQGGERTNFTVKDGLPTNQVRCIHQDTDGTMWFGTYGGGIVRLRDGRFQSL